ncbi:DUF4265 domain-containing protein [Burkholderia plantarii]|uniref:DUF4265 domain-containing protein n=1 Tax=Burkholderia plantarii TaxID=41899 RepID=UPI0009F54D44|nr:DUF4265 domain-containing protein [Burkholderia plantarii]
MELIEIFAGRTTAGEPVREELPAQAIGDGTYELLASPGVASNIAKGDVIRVLDASGSIEIIRRGGNVCVQTYFSPYLESKDRQEIEANFLTRLTGSVDGESDRNMCFSIPVGIGFSAIGNFFNNLTNKYSQVSWSYGNVYGEDGVTPLNWWIGG